MPFLDPIEYPESWLTATIDGVVTPGVCTFSDGARVMRVDEKDAPGSNGATATKRGRKLSHPKMKLLLWLPDHFYQWAKLVDILDDNPTKKADAAHLVEYPALALNGITELLVIETGQLTEDQPGSGLWSVTVSWCEFSPASKANVTSTPKGTAAKPASSGPGQPGSSGIQPTSAEVEQQKRLKEALAAAGFP